MLDNTLTWRKASVPLARKRVFAPGSSFAMSSSSNKPVKPTKPRAPKPVADAVQQAVRMAEHKRHMDEYDEAMKEHRQSMEQRKKEQEATWREAAPAPASAGSKRAASSSAAPRASRPRVGTMRPRVPQVRLNCGAASSSAAPHTSHPRVGTSRPRAHPDPSPAHYPRTPMSILVPRIPMNVVKRVGIRYGQLGLLMSNALYLCAPRVRLEGICVRYCSLTIIHVRAAVGCHRKKVPSTGRNRKPGKRYK